MVEAVHFVPDFGFHDSWIFFSGSKWARHAWNYKSIGLVAGPLDVRHKWKVFDDASWGTVDSIVLVSNQPHELYAFQGGHYFRAKFDPGDELKPSFVYHKNTPLRMPGASIYSWVQQN